MSEEKRASVTASGDIPEGLEIERTPSGGFRFELPRPKWAWVGLIFGLPFMLLFMGFAIFWIWGWCHQAPSVGVAVGGALFGSLFVLVPLGVLYAALKAAFGRQHLEVDGREISITSQLPPLPPSRKRIPLGEVTGIVVDDLRGSKGGVRHYLNIKTAKKERHVGEGLERPVLEWLAARLAALAGRGDGNESDLLAVFEADRRSDHLEAAPTAEAALAAAGEEGLGAPPEKSGITVLEAGRGLLRLKLQAKGGKGLTCFGVAWLAITGTVTAGFAWAMVSGNTQGDPPPLYFIIPFMAIFWAIGVGMLLAGLRQRSLLEHIEIRRGEVSWQATSILGARQRTLSGRGMRIERAESYQQNEQPVYHLRITCPGEEPIKFAGNVAAAGQGWLLARIGAELKGSVEPDMAELVESGRLDEVDATELRAPPRGTGISITQERRHFLELRLAARGGRQLLIFSLVWNSIIGVVITVIFFASDQPGDFPPIFACVILGIFALVGVATLVTGLKYLTLVENLEVRPGEVSWRALSILGPRRRQLRGEDIRIVRKESYKQNNRPVYHLRFTCPEEKPIKFAPNIKPEGQTWLMARIAKALEVR